MNKIIITCVMGKRISDGGFEFFNIGIQLDEKLTTAELMKYIINQAKNNVPNIPMKELCVISITDLTNITTGL